ncbi:MAG: type II toxin-antitoxin system VapC family toxin [Candidatus Brocadia sp.]
MTLSDKLSQINTIFIDTAPIIYFIEAHPKFGLLTMGVVEAFQTGKINAFSSVLILTEVLSKPIETGDQKLAKRFSDFLKYGKNLRLVEISVSIAERAGKLRGQCSGLRTIDAIQVFVATNIGVDAFLTNDEKLKQIKEINVLFLKDYV